MSNSLAVAAATTTLRYVLERALQTQQAGPVGGARTTTLRPDQLNTGDLSGQPCINLFLYQVTANHSITLDDQPTRRADGSLARRPYIALDLHYLITCHGQDDALEPQRLLGLTALAFALTPVMTRDVVIQAMAGFGTDPALTFLTDSDLADGVDLVRVAPASLSLEEHSKLWSVMLQTSYQLSLTYTASVVVLQPEATPRASLPVQSRTLVVTAAGPPRLEDVLTDPPGGVVVVGATLTLIGSDLVAGPSEVTSVGIGPAQLTPDPSSTTQRVVANVDDSVPAGLHRVQVVHRSVPAGGQPARTRATSNALPLLVRPVVAVQSVTATDITLTLHPPLFPGQRATVTLQTAPGDPGPSRTVSSDLAPVPPGGTPQPTVSVPRTAVPDGQWLLRIRVDDVDSVPTLVGDVYGAPLVTLP